MSDRHARTAGLPATRPLAGFRREDLRLVIESGDDVVVESDRPDEWLRADCARPLDDCL